MTGGPPSRRYDQADAENTQPGVDPEPPRPARLNRRLVLAAAFVLTGTIALALHLGFQAPVPSITAATPDIESPNLLHSDILHAAPRVSYRELTRPPDPVPVSPPEPTPAMAVAAQTAVAVEPSPVPASATVTPTAPEDPESAARRRQLAQEAEEARRSGLFFSGRSPATSDSTAGITTTAMAPYATPGFEPAALTGDAQNHQADKRSFATSVGPAESYLDRPYRKPLSRFEVKAGTVIPGALLTGLNSDLPGQIIGRITQNVFDSATGDHLLIPQGTTVIGRYNSVVAFGQRRAQIVWDRLIMPDGRSIELATMAGTDQAGYAGLYDRVDHHWDRLAAGIVLSTGISVLANLATNREDRGSIVGDVGDAAAQEAARVGSEFTRRNLNVQPTLKVRPGWPFNIIVHKDMILAPYS
ncbi:MAG: TrbI/VirB10 family protein [Rhodospirillales bacterium]|nr:MAG: TrbI/VirB10 family protein [Rhodospirillales bacterium]